MCCIAHNNYQCLARKASAFIPGMDSADAESIHAFEICATPKQKPMQQLSLFNDATGIELGLKAFAATSDGAVIEVRQFYPKVEEKLAVAQRANKTDRVKALHARIANRRKDFHHKLGTLLVTSYGAIVVGNVNASALAKTNQAKSVLDAGWRAFRTMLQYKCDHAGVWFDAITKPIQPRPAAAVKSALARRAWEVLE
jgi:putative transposase